MYFILMAYLDGGSGSILLQMAIAALLALGVATRAYWGKIKGWFGIKAKPEEDNDDAAEK